MLLKWLNFNKKKKSMYLADNRGTAAIEFAIVSPAFLLLFIGTFEVAFIVLIQSTLETAVYQASRFGRTGGTVAGQTPKQTAKALVDQYTFGLVDTAKLVFTVTPYANFAAMPLVNGAPSTGEQNFGAGNQAVLYTLSYQWNFFTPLVGKLLTANGTFTTLTASAVVQNEPF